MDAYLPEEHYCQISSQSELKDTALGFFCEINKKNSAKFHPDLI